MICLLSPYAFVLCYQLSAVYGIAFYVRDQSTCIEVIDGQERIRLKSMIDMDNHEFYGCGHAEQVIGKYR